jgi:hypothetical protein
MDLVPKDKKKTPTPEQVRILLVGNWLKRYAQTFPMYGKTLEDFPERFGMFLKALEDQRNEDIEAGFLECVKACNGFPVPAEVLDASRRNAARRYAADAERKQLEDRKRDDQIKAQRFLGNGEDQTAKLEAEFKELLQRAKLKAI